MSKYYRTERALAASRLKFKSNGGIYKKYITALVHEVLPMFQNPFGTTLQEIKQHLLNSGEVETNIMELFHDEKIQAKIIESDLTEEYSKILQEQIVRHERAQKIAKHMMDALPTPTSSYDSIDARARAKKELLDALSTDEPQDLHKIIESFVARKAKYKSLIKIIDCPEVRGAIEESNQIDRYISFMENELDCLMPFERVNILKLVDAQMPKRAEVIPVFTASAASSPKAPNPFDESFERKEVVVEPATKELALPISIAKIAPAKALPKLQPYQLQEYIEQLRIVQEKQAEAQSAIDNLSIMLSRLLDSAEPSEVLISSPSAASYIPDVTSTALSGDNAVSAANCETQEFI